MGDLRDQLKKAKLLSKKDARRLAHEERVERKEKGREGLDADREKREIELRRLQRSERGRTQAAQQELEERRQVEEELAACQSILQRESRRAGPGSLRWFFEIEDGQIPWLELSPMDQKQLQSGMLCVVRHGPPGTHTYRLLASDLARRVAKTLSAAVVWAPRGVI